MTIKVRGTRIMVSPEEEQRYTLAEREFKAAERRAASLGRLAEHKARMLREMASFRMNITEMRDGASADLLSAIASDVQELISTMTELSEAQRG